MDKPWGTYSRASPCGARQCIEPGPHQDDRHRVVPGMKLTPVIFGLFCILGTVREASSADDWDTAVGEVNAIFEKFAADTHAPGLVYGIVRAGAPAYVRGIGVQDQESQTPVSAETVFRIASLTKSFTALAVLNLRDGGLLDLESPAISIVPELKVIPQAVAEAGTGTSPVRLRQLLSHTAGLVTDDPWADRQLDMSESEFSAYLARGIPLAQSPGEAFDYSNTGYAVLGRVISNTSKQPYQDYISQILFKPLAMTSTFWEMRDVPASQRAVGYSWVDDHYEAQPALADGAFGAMAGIWTSANDYGRFVAWLLAAWSDRPTQMEGSVNPRSAREAGHGVTFSQMALRPDGPPGGPGGNPCPVVWMYGAGFYAVSDCELGTMLRHPGGLPGFGSQVLLLPEAGVGIFAFANLTYAHLSGPVVEAAIHLKRAGLLEGFAMPVSSELNRAAVLALRIYQNGFDDAVNDEVAMNLFLDRSAERRNAELKNFRNSVGACKSTAPSEILNAMAGRFKLTCETGELQVSILLSPTSPPKFQYLEFEDPGGNSSR